MRVHSDALTRKDFRDAAKAAGVTFAHHATTTWWVVVMTADERAAIRMRSIREVWHRSAKPDVQVVTA